MSFLSDGRFARDFRLNVDGCQFGDEILEAKGNDDAADGRRLVADSTNDFGLAPTLLRRNYRRREQLLAIQANTSHAAIRYVHESFLRAEREEKKNIKQDARVLEPVVLAHWIIYNVKRFQTVSILLIEGLKRKPTARMEQNDSEREMNLNLSQAISEMDDTSAIETRGATNGRPVEQSDLQQQQQEQRLRRLSLLELGATMRQDGEEVTSLCNQLRESNIRAKLQSDKVERINAIRRKISKVTNKASEDYEHFLKIVEENRDMDQEEMRNCVVQPR